MLPCQTLGEYNVFSLHCFHSLSCVNEYLAIDSGGHLRMDGINALTAAWLDASY